MATKTRRRRAPAGHRVGPKLSAEEHARLQGERVAAGKAKAAAAIERLDAGISRLIESDEAFAEYLRLSGRMHGYSAGNRLLIYLQRPDAGMVAGFHRWAELGRPVVKGSKGIQILAPMVVKDRERIAAGVDDARRVVGFRVSYVFSVRDTDGAPIGIPHPVEVVDDGERAHALLELLWRQAEQVCEGGVSWETTLPDGVGGYYHHGEHRIALRGGVSAGESCHTLVHELAHHYAGRDEKSRADRELIAEGAGFVAASFYGLDTLGYAVPYVAGWASGDVARFRALLDRIMSVAGELIGDGETCPQCLGAGCEGCK